QTTLVPTLCVGMQANNSSFPRSAWECRQTTPRSHALRGNAGKQLLVPTLCVGMQARRSASCSSPGSREQDAERPGCIPTQSVGTRCSDTLELRKYTHG
ncbi:MAG: hypothetical protein GY749_32385, partial [Desulfobacteraceae bacterium]|nr:hypothetical protein [Desulfobacteraceae bacterium]